MRDIFVLGINVSHDVSCAILKNGQLLCAIAEERLNRIKRYTGGVDREGMTNKHLPLKAIKYCLDVAGICLQDVDLIVVSTCVVVNYENYKTRQLTKEEILGQFPFMVDPQKVHLAGHHLGHAASVFYPSEFKDAAIIVVDGGGNLVERNNGGNVPEHFEERVSIFHGQNNDIKAIKQYWDGRPSDGYLSSAQHCSLGDFYQSATLFVGFKGGDEGKTMGLAPYGTDRYFKEFVEAIRFNHQGLSIDGDFQFNKWNGNTNGKKFYGGRFGEPRKSGEPLRQVDKDVAAGAQYALEETLIRIAEEAYEITKSKNLCLSGGVALNSVANKKVLDRTSFENVFIQPASGDDGCAVGNALLGWSIILGKERKPQIKKAYMGRSYSQEEIRRAVRKYKGWVSPVVTGDVIKEAGWLIAQRHILGWFQGGSEFGPRSLGHRSILCDTRFPDMKDILNKRVKHRESFRPFAPSILEEYNSEYFDLDCPSPYMLLIAKVKKPGVVPAITHVDQTARVQTVNKEENDRYYDLVKEYHKLTGVPVILNTSFNVAGEPIVETPEDAIRCFISTQIDYLVLGDTLLAKKRLKCRIFKEWPQELKRQATKKLKLLAGRYPFLKTLKKKTDKLLNKSQNRYAKVPG